MYSCLMASINDILTRLDTLSVSQEAQEALIDSSDNIRDAQRDQLLHGIKKDGTGIGKYRNKKYAQKKFDQNPLAGLGNVDWKLTGALHKDIFIDVRSDVFVIDSADSKTGDLIKKYGDPFGLTPKSRETVIKEKLQENLVKRIKNKLNL